MAKIKKPTNDDKLAEIEKKLELLTETKFVNRIEWIRPPDHEYNLKNPERCRISNWDSKEQFYNTYKTSDDRGKLQLFNMFRRLINVNSNENKNFFLKTFSKKNFLFYLWVASFFVLFLLATVVLYIFLTNKIGQNNNIPIYLVLGMATLFSFIIFGYLLLRVNKYRAYKNEWIKTYFGSFWKQKNTKFIFSKQEKLEQIAKLKSFKELNEFPDVFSDQDFLNFKVLFFREYFFHEAINPSFKYRVKYNFLSFNFLLIHLFIIAALVGGIILIVLTARGI